MILNFLKMIKNNIMETQKEKALRELSELKKETSERIAALERTIENCDKPKNIMDRVKTLEDAISIKRLNECEIRLIVPCALKKYADKLQATVEIQLIADVLNEGWEADWNNLYERKYYPYFSTSGSGLAYDFCLYVDSRTYVGARPAFFKTDALAIYAGKQFLPIYNRIFLGK